MNAPENFNPIRTDAPSPSAPVATKAEPSARPELDNYFSRIIKASPDAVQSAIRRGSPNPGEWGIDCGRIYGYDSCCTKELGGVMTCGCGIVEEWNSYVGAHDPAFGGTKRRVIKEILWNRQDCTEDDGAWTLKLFFIPCKELVCPGSLKEVTHTVRQDPTHPARTWYTRTETVVINDMQYFINARFENRSIYEIHLESLRRKADALAEELEIQPFYFQ